MFDDIGHINMNWAGIPPFNWQMLLSEPCPNNRDEMKEIVTEFCDLDNINFSIAIVNAEESPAEKDILNNNAIVDEHITVTLKEKFGSLEKCYPYIVKHLFAEDGAAKPSHKQTFWRIFGDIAVANIRKNLADCKTCPECGMRIPAWSNVHTCPKNDQGFYECIDCGKMCNRTNSRQQRCPECQEHRRYDLKQISRRKTKEEKEERGKKFITFLQSQCKKT